MLTTTTAASCPSRSLPKRRWFRYSLRTLMLFVTACAFACSWLAVKMQEAKRQREAVEALRDAGGEVYYDYELDAANKPVVGAPPVAPAWLRSILGDDFFDNVIEVETYEDQALQHIKRFPKLRSLSFFCGIGVTDVGMANLQYVPELRKLRFGSGQERVTSAGLAYLRFVKKLQRLEIRGAPITDTDLQYLEEMAELEELTLDGGITDAGLTHLNGLKRLKLLELRRTRVTKSGVEALQEVLPNCRIKRVGTWIARPVLPVSNSNGAADDPFGKRQITPIAPTIPKS